jgi:hypothetical protein
MNILHRSMQWLREVRYFLLERIYRYCYFIYLFIENFLLFVLYRRRVEEVCGPIPCSQSCVLWLTFLFTHLRCTIWYHISWRVNAWQTLLWLGFYMYGLCSTNHMHLHKTRVWKLVMIKVAACGTFYSLAAVAWPVWLRDQGLQYHFAGLWIIGEMMCSWSQQLLLLHLPNWENLQLLVDVNKN